MSHQTHSAKRTENDRSAMREGKEMTSVTKKAIEDLKKLPGYAIVSVRYSHMERRSMTESITISRTSSRQQERD